MLHQDHGASPAGCQQSIRSGFTSGMMDGSLKADAKTPASCDDNIDVTRRDCEIAHAVGVSVEGELGCLGSLETGQAGEEDGVGAEGTLTRDMMLTDPAQAKEFVARTGVDAIAIGTSHGSYKFTRQPTGDILAMHGSSSLPQEWLAIIRQYGGDLTETCGVPVEEIRRAINSGVRKVDIDTDNRLAMTGAMRQAFAKDPSGFEPRNARFEAFGCADRIKPVTMEALIQRYRRWPCTH